MGREEVGAGAGNRARDCGLAVRRVADYATPACVVSFHYIIGPGRETCTPKAHRF